MNPVGVGLALATGLGSALVPVLSAEVHALVVATGPLHTLPAVVLALAAGQAAGKLVLFETGRRGRAWHPWGRRCPPARTAQWTERVGEWLRTPRHGVPAVLAAASLGIPPLAVVSVAAGAAGQRRRVFAPRFLLGRIVRFGVLVLPVVAAPLTARGPGAPRADPARRTSSRAPCTSEGPLRPQCPATAANGLRGAQRHDEADGVDTGIR